MQTPKLAFVGDLTVDVYPKLHKSRLGGSSLTCAVWSKRLGADATILAGVGSQSLRGGAQSATTWQSTSKMYLDFCQKEKINPDYIKILPGLISNIEIFLDKNGDRSFGKWDPGVLTDYHFTKKDYDFLLIQNAVAMPVYFKTKHLLDELLSLGLPRNNPMSPKPLIVIDFDDLSQFKKDTKIIEDHLPYIDIVVVGLDIDADAKIIRKLQKLASSCHPPCSCHPRAGGDPYNPYNIDSRFHGNDKVREKLFVVTLNKNGSIAFCGNKVFRQKAQKVKVVDSTGAGDSFLAGFLVEYVKSKDVQKSLLAGTKIASKAITQLGTY